jgi:hypothetical protein
MWPKTAAPLPQGQGRCWCSSSAVLLAAGYLGYRRPAPPARRSTTPLPDLLDMINKSLLVPPGADHEMTAAEKTCQTPRSHYFATAEGTGQGDRRALSLPRQ